MKRFSENFIFSKKTTLLVFFLSSLIFSLSAQTLTGTVQDTLKLPLPNANVIAKPKQAQAKIKFAIADHLGRYRLELDKATDYEVKVSYIGYKEQVFHYEAINFYYSTS